MCTTDEFLFSPFALVEDKAVSLSLILQRLVTQYSFMQVKVVIALIEPSIVLLALVNLL